MTIEGINTGIGVSSGSSEISNSGSDSEQVGMDQFLTLFIAQIKNQDPLSPLDSAEFTAQLAQFTSVEQLYGMNINLTDIKETLNNRSEQQNIIGLIGKTVKAIDNSLIVDDETVHPGSYTIDKRSEVAVSVYDSEGFNVRTIYQGWEDKGEHDVNWDGRDDQGKLVENGTYTFEVTARDEYGRYIPADTSISGEVTGVSYEYGQPYLMLGERIIIDVNNIIEVSQTTTEN